jgi:hypothetical protein
MLTIVPSKPQNPALTLKEEKKAGELGLRIGEGSSEKQHLFLHCKTRL